MLVSIVITSYNYGAYVRRCIESCLGQDLGRDVFEIILVDDCSSDHTQAVLMSYEGVENFRYSLNPANVGVAEAANIGIRLAQGRFVTRVDADDYVAPDFAVRLADYLLRHQEAFCVSCDYHHVDQHGEWLRTRSARTHPISCGIMYRRAELIDAGLYSAGWRHREEEELRLRLSERYAIHHLDEPLYFYVQHGENKTTQKEQMELYRRRLVDLYSPRAMPRNR